MKQFFVYILASKPYGVLYIGVTSDLIKRISEHIEGIHEGFAKRYHVKRLVYYEEHGSAEYAILREKRLKEWKRSMKIDLIEKHNPLWEDLWPMMTGQNNSMDTKMHMKIPAFAGMTTERV